jgi:hypothetical protein
MCSLIKYFGVLLIRFNFTFFNSSFRAYLLGDLLLWSDSGAMQAVFSTPLRLTAPLIPKCCNLIRHCFPQVLTVARINVSVSCSVSPMGERPFPSSPPSFFLERTPMSCQGSSSIPHSSGYVILSVLGLIFSINYVTAGASYCLRAYFPVPKRSQETYDACQQYLLSPGH